MKIIKKPLPGPMGSYIILEGTARYAGLLLAPVKGFGLHPRLFVALLAKQNGICLLFIRNLWKRKHNGKTKFKRS